MKKGGILGGSERERNWREMGKYFEMKCEELNNIVLGRELDGNR